MSLKAFHVVFITVSVLLCMGFGLWCLDSEYARAHPSYAIAGAISFVVGAGLVVYEVLFLRKMRENR